MVWESFPEIPFYLTTSKENAQLMADIDQAMAEMTEQEPTWQKELFDAYFQGETEHIAISEAEADYLQWLDDTDTVIKVLVNPDRMPYSYLDNGQFKGILPALFEAMAKPLNLSYTYIPVSTRAEYLAMRDSDEVDVLLDFFGDQRHANSLNMLITNPYLSTGFMEVRRTSTMTPVERVAILGDSLQMQTFADDYYHDKQLLYYPTMADCLEALHRGEVDTAMLYSYCAESWMHWDVRRELRFVSLPDVHGSFRLAVSNKDGHYLRSLLNKAINHLDSSAVELILQEESALQYTPNVVASIFQ